MLILHIEEIKPIEQFSCFFIQNVCMGAGNRALFLTFMKMKPDFYMFSSFFIIKNYMSFYPWTYVKDMQEMKILRADCCPVGITNKADIS